MKKNLLVALMSGLISLPISFQVLVAQESINTIRAGEIYGKVMVIDELLQVEEVLEEGQVLSQEKTVITGTNGSSVLYFSNGASIVLGPDTRLTIEAFIQEPYKDDTVVYDELRSEPSISNTQVFLHYGAITVRTKQLQEESGFQVQSPNSVADLLSATAQITYLSEASGGMTTVANLYGNVKVKDNDPSASWVDIDEGSLREVAGSTEGAASVAPDSMVTKVSEQRLIEESDVVVDFSIVQIGENASPAN